MAMASLECPAPESRPGIPKNMMKYNGVRWPAACFNDTEEQHFFIIGDWGGQFPHTTFNNRHGIPEQPDIDPFAQTLVANVMAQVALSSKPKYVINVGDNFYPGGIGVSGECNPAEGRFESQGQAGIIFDNTFEAVYNGTALQGVEWWGVLGNHDYGGYYYSVHWDQNIFYTWAKDKSRWLTPALYWSRNVQYDGFSADFFFMDTNLNDAKAPPIDPEHNICNNVHNSEPYARCNGTSIFSPQTCLTFFQDLWSAQTAWLEKGLAASTADWQIVVTHYPPTFDPCSSAWENLFAKYGVDLYISGHTHLQQIVYPSERYGNTAYIISGGGGGITSEIMPDPNGNDDAYGFVDVAITKEHLKVKMYSHGGVDHKLIVRNTTLISPRKPAAPEEVSV